MGENTVAEELIIEHGYFGVRMQNGCDRSIAPPTKWFRNEVLSLSRSSSPSLPLFLFSSPFSFTLFSRSLDLSVSLLLSVNLARSPALSTASDVWFTTSFYSRWNYELRRFLRKSDYARNCTPRRRRKLCRDARPRLQRKARRGRRDSRYFW